jgi:hypothetical protein
MVRSSRMVYPQISYLGPAHPERPGGIGTVTRELDSRTNDGIHVRLLWHPNDARVSVTVHDTTTNEAFELPVPDGSRALDVFHHPYVYAAGRVRATEPGSGALRTSVPGSRQRPQTSAAHDPSTSEG